MIFQVATFKAPRYNCSGFKELIPLVEEVARHKQSVLRLEKLYIVDNQPCIGRLLLPCYCQKFIGIFHCTLLGPILENLKIVSGENLKFDQGYVYGNRCGGVVICNIRGALLRRSQRVAMLFLVSIP